MGEHFCQYTVSYEDDFKAIPCDKPAPIKHENAWLCAEHYDLIEESFGRAAEGGEYWGLDVDMEDDWAAEVFEEDEDDPFADTPF
jgi:hypothetical protein